MDLAGLRARLEQRAKDAEAMKATAPIADVLRVVLSELEAIGATPAPAATDRMLTAQEAAPLLGVTPRWLYDHARQLPFARRLSRKCLRFSEAGLLRHRERQRAA